MAGERRMEAGLAKLEARFGSRVTTAVRSLDECSRDFGGLVRKVPSVVVRPRDPSEAATALAVAAEHGLTVSTRGSGHSQSGQCVGGDVVLDMRELNRVTELSETGELIVTEAGIRWKDVVDTTFRRRRLPPGLTHVLDTTVAGTLSVGGVGGESFRVGPQVDNVAFLDVATPDGGITRCSLSEQRDLFDAVRAGLGQCGVIVRVGYPLRKCRTRVRSRWFVYLSLERFMTDVERVVDDGSASFVSAIFARNPRQPTRLVVALVLGYEYDDSHDLSEAPGKTELACDEVLPEKDAPLWDESGIPGHTFFRLYAPNPGSIDADPSTLHPWVDHIFDRDAAFEMFREHQDGRSQVLSLGTNALIFIRRSGEAAPLFACPSARGLLWGLGVFPSVPPSLAEELLPKMRDYARRGQELGGKRYLSGYLDFHAASDWMQHYGNSWLPFQAAKRRFDPSCILNPGFVRWR